MSKPTIPVASLPRVHLVQFPSLVLRWSSDLSTIPLTVAVSGIEYVPFVRTVQCRKPILNRRTHALQLAAARAVI